MNPQELTTETNVAMLRELRLTLAELIRQRQIDDAYPGLGLTAEMSERKKIRDDATAAVMLSISVFCKPYLTFSK